MRLALLVAVAALACGSACGGSRPVSGAAAPGGVAAFPATRWVPAHPAYVVTSKSVREAQRSLHDLIDSVGMLGGIDGSEVSAALQRLLAVDPLNPDALAAMGIDLNGGIAMFSEDLSPTFVVRLTAPDQTQAFFDRQRERGLVTQSVIVDGIEVFTAQLLRDAKVSWARSEDWLWVHFALPFTKDTGTAWFTNSRKPQGTPWIRDWEWSRTATQHDRPAMAGFVDMAAVLAIVAPWIPEGVKCTQLIAPLKRVGLSIDGDATGARGRLAFDLGPSAASVNAAVMPVPEGFAIQAAGAPLSAQWNLDLLAVRAWLRPCLHLAKAEAGLLEEYGVRSGRVVLQSFDPDDKTGAGVVALDLANNRFLMSRLDDIPMRSSLERNRKFGPLAGHSISIPFVATVDYVLTDKLAFAAMGDGLLAKVVGAGGTVRGPVAAIDVMPGAMSAEAWKVLLGALDGRNAGVFVDRLMRWREGHVALTIEGQSLVLVASGTRR